MPVTTTESWIEQRGTVTSIAAVGLSFHLAVYERLREFAVDVGDESREVGRQTELSCNLGARDDCTRAEGERNTYRAVTKTIRPNRCVSLGDGACDRAVAIERHVHLPAATTHEVGSLRAAACRMGVLGVTDDAVNGRR